MSDNIERGEDGLPLTNEKELAEMDKLFSSEQYKLKATPRFLRSSKKWFINHDFVMHTLEDFVRHLHSLKIAAKKMLPQGAYAAFLSELRRKNPAAADLLRVLVSIEVKSLNEMLNILQSSARTVSVSMLQPFMKTLYKPLIRIYYLEPEYAASCLMDTYRLILENYVPASPEAFQKTTMRAVQELKYVYSDVFPATYPLVLRMTSPVMLSERDLFYKNGSKVLNWLDVPPNAIIFPAEENEELSPAEENEEMKPPDAQPAPEDVMDGLAMLERLFPQAGWEKIPYFPDERIDFAPYFVKILSLSDTLIQVNPDHPMHLTMILILILSELFQGVRHIEFHPLPLDENVYTILDDWIMYIENVFERTFGSDLNAYTHQAYSQADFAKTTYASRLTSNMYSIIRQYFLPYYDMQFLPYQKTPIGHLPPLYPRVARLREILEDSIRPHMARASDFSEAAKPLSLYRFDISNPVSRRLDAIYSGKVRRRTNRTLISCCVSILAVLDWWMNNAGSPAYKKSPRRIYRTENDESHTPAFGVVARTDIDAIFKNSLKRHAADNSSEGNNSKEDSSKEDKPKEDAPEKNKSKEGKPKKGGLKATD